MRTVADLVKAAQPASPGSTRPDYTISVQTADPLGPVLYHLMKYFGTEEKRESVALEVDGVLRGYLPRAALYQFVGPINRAPGAGDHAGLPGHESFRVYRFRCPTPECGRTVGATFYDAKHPPRCPVHPTETLQPLP
jgi:hypothetical protein